MRSEFLILFPGGDFYRFNANLPEIPNGVADIDVLNVQLSEIEILEQGNHLIGNAADELPQVSL